MSGVWLQILDRYGIAIVLLLAMGIFLWKAVWPFMMEQIRMSQASREKALDVFAAALKESNDTHRQAVAEIVKAIGELRDEVRRKG